MANSATDVFVSYKAEDRARLLPLVKALEAKGFNVWWDAHIGGGTDWREEIQHHLDTARCVIVAWSERSVGPEGRFVRDEATRAQRLGSYVPIRIDSVEPPLGFGEVQAINFIGWKGKPAAPCYVALVDAVNEHLTGEAPIVRRAVVAEPKVSRRTVMAGGVGALAVAGGGIWWASNREHFDPRFQGLIDQAEEAVRHETADQQTLRTLEQAVSIRPGNAKALGLLALVKSLVAQGSDPKDAASLIPSAERTAQRALAIDPKEPNALVAMFELQGSTLDWFTRDRKLRQIIALDPKNIRAISELILLLQGTGFVQESWDWNERALALEPLSSQILGRRAFKLWIRGKLPEADKVADQLRALYPADPWGWYVRFKIYAFTGRAKTAEAMLNGNPDMGGWPQPARFWRAALEALAQPSSAAIAKARQACIEGAERSPGVATEGVQVMSILSQVDTAFDIANGVLLSRGPVVRLNQGGSSDAQDAAWRISTQWMFTPPADAMRADRRFLPLCEGIGLTEYWRKRGTKPDYLRV